jgi:hypothetical protein
MVVVRCCWRANAQTQWHVADFFVCSFVQCFTTVCNCSHRYFEGTTKDTDEEFDTTVDSWDDMVMAPFEDFLKHVYCTYFLFRWVRLSTDSLCLAPEICASVALRSNTQSRSATPALSQSTSRTGTPMPGTEPPVGRLTPQLTLPPIGGLHKPRSNDVKNVSTQLSLKAANGKLQKQLPAAKTLSAYEIEREKNIAANKLLLDKAEKEVLKKLGISGPLPPLFPKKVAKKNMPRTKRPLVPADQLRCGRSAAQGTS